MAGAVTFNARDLLPAYNDVLQGGETNYALFTLVSSFSTNELKLVAAGTGGLEELEDEFQDGKVMWAFVRVKDPGSGLNKFVLVNWVGDGVPERQKGMFPTHSRDVTSKLLKGAHVTIQARDSADVVPAQILKKVADSSGSKYSVHNEPAQKYSAPAPVQSSYKPIGQPVITPSRVMAPPTPVGTAYVSKRDELASIRASVASKSAAPPPTMAPKPTADVVGGSSSYASKRDELAEIRRTQEGLVGKREEFDAPPARAAAPASSFPSISLPSRPTASSAPAKPASSFPSISLPSRPVAATPAARVESAASTDRPAPVGTSYTPVSLPKPGKLGNRWAQAQAAPKDEDSAPSPPASAPTPARASFPAPSFNRPVATAAAVATVSLGAGAAKALTWSERQALAKQQQAQEAPAVVASQEEDDEFETPPVPQQNEDEKDDDDFETPVAPRAPPPPPAPSTPVVAKVEVEPEPEEEKEEPREAGFYPAPQAPPPPPFIAAGAVAAPVVEEVEAPVQQVAAMSIQDGGAGGGGAKAQVLFAYAKDEDNEMDLIEGEILTNIEMIDEGWWSGRSSDGREGLFPSNYVELLPESDAAEVAPPPAPPAPPMPARPSEPEAVVEAGPVAVALYEYAAAEEGELSFSENDKITGIEFVSEEWWQGIAPDGSVGVFPANYVELKE